MIVKNKFDRTETLW